MAPEELDRLNREIETLRSEIRRLQDRLDRADGERSLSARSEQEAGRGGDQGDIGSLETEGEKRLGDEDIRTRIRKHPYYSLLILLLAGGLAGPGYWGWNYLHSYESTSDARIDGLITPISSRVAGTVTRVFVRDDQSIKVGQPLVALDPRDYQLLVRRAHAMLDAARAGVKAARRRNDAALAKYREALTSRQRPAAEAARNIADEASDALSAKIAAEHQAEAALDQAQLQLDYTTIKAPVSGVVAKRSATVGERVQPSQRLLAIVQTSELWVTANFKETQLMRIHPGERVAIHVDALGRDYRGYVKSVAPATRSEFSLLPPENATGNFVKVVQRVAVSVLFDPGQDLRGLKPGMSVEPKVWVDGR